MKILFVIKEEDPIDPMNVELLSALAKREGHETFLNVLQHGDLAETLRKLEPDVVAYSGKTGEHKTFYKVNRFVKETRKDKVFTIMGGPHPTFNHKGIQLFGETPQEVPAARTDAAGQAPAPGRKQRHVILERSDLDALCIGEGDDAWVELLRALALKSSIDDIPNIITRSNRRKYPEPLLRPRRTSLDDLPFYDRQLVYDKTFLGHFPMRSFMASRGCPFRCTYCFNYDWNKTYRDAHQLGKLHNRYSVDRLIAEMQDMLRLEKERGYAPTQFIKFYDDIFEFRAGAWLEEFAEKFPKEIGLPFFCLTRCDLLAHEEADGRVTLHEEMLRLLKKAGLRSISMSIEAGNNFIRENILVRDMTEREIRASFELMAKHRIGTFANTILGIPAPVIPRRGEPSFDEKLAEAIRKTRLAFTVAKKQVEPGSRGGLGYPLELDALRDRLEKDPSEETRSEAVRILESLGLRYDPLDYDIQSVELNIQCGIHHTMFPRLDPYPGTVITDYTMAIGAFDGDFEKLHSSYDTTSSFTCFTDRQKMVQDNLSFLGQVCAIWPWLWPVSKRYLIYLPLTRLYWLAFLLMKTYVIKRHIYPMRLGWNSLLRSAYRILLVEYKKFFQGESSPEDILGARWEK